ncbi:DUF3192 domain-containing protein [Paraglaciecola sp.]|uniref:DUF3192 domain-containing protein n=1 Tax=Paraglaciecola sp. TaxID=1920173 RepID=UPI003EF1F446
MRKILTLSLLGLSLGLSGCVISIGGESAHSYQSDWKNKEHKNRKLIAKLTADVTYESVVNRFGIADFNEFYKVDASTYQVLYYRTQKVDADGITSKEECTPLVFKDGYLHGWGDDAFSMISH